MLNLLSVKEDNVKKTALIILFLSLSLALSASTLPLSLFDPVFAASDDDDEDDEFEFEDEGGRESKKSKKKAEQAEEEDEFTTSKPAPVEKDEFLESSRPAKKSEDDFFQKKSDDSIYANPEEDDFVVEKREKGVKHQYKSPDICKVSAATYLYTEASVKSKKLFELYKGDDLEVIEESGEFYKVKFLGKEGWVPREDVRLEKWYTYRLSLELVGGAGSGKGDFNNFDVIGSYALRLNVAVIQDFVIGIEGRGLSLDHDSLYAGGGLMLRYYIHGLRTKKTRSAISASAGYIGGVEKLSGSLVSYRVFGGPYVNTSLDYYFRVWEYIVIGVGGEFQYSKFYGSASSFNLEKEFYQGGAHLSLMFNVLR